MNVRTDEERTNMESAVTPLEPVLRARGLTKRYGHVSALTGADLTAASVVGSDLTGVDPAEVVLRGTVIDERQAVVLAEAFGMVVVPAR